MVSSGLLVRGFQNHWLGSTGKEASAGGCCKSWRAGTRLKAEETSEVKSGSEANIMKELQ